MQRIPYRQSVGICRRRTERLNNHVVSPSLRLRGEGAVPFQKEEDASPLLLTVNFQRIPLLSAFAILQSSVSTSTTITLITAAYVIPYFTAKSMTLTLIICLRRDIPMTAISPNSQSLQNLSTKPIVTAKISSANANMVIAEVQAVQRRYWSIFTAEESRYLQNTNTIRIRWYITKYLTH